MTLCFLLLLISSIFLSKKTFCNAGSPSKHPFCMCGQAFIWLCVHIYQQSLWESRIPELHPLNNICLTDQSVVSSFEKLLLSKQIIIRWKLIEIPLKSCDVLLLQLQGCCLGPYDWEKPASNLRKGYKKFPLKKHTTYKKCRKQFLLDLFNMLQEHIGSFPLTDGVIFKLFSTMGLLYP